MSLYNDNPSSKLFYKIVDARPEGGSRTQTKNFYYDRNITSLTAGAVNRRFGYGIIARKLCRRREQRRLFKKSVLGL
jgi:hypothetical protein